MTIAIRLLSLVLALGLPQPGLSSGSGGSEGAQRPKTVLIIRDAQMRMFFITADNEKYSIEVVDEKDGKELARLEGEGSDRINALLKRSLEQGAFTKGAWSSEVTTDPNEFTDSCLVALATEAEGGYVIRYLKDRNQRAALFSELRDLLANVMKEPSPVCGGLRYEHGPTPSVELSPR